MRPSAKRKILTVLISAMALSGWLAWAAGWEETARWRRDFFDLEDLNAVLLKDIRFFKEHQEPGAALHDRLKTQQNMIADLRTRNNGLQTKLSELYTALQKTEDGGRSSAVELGTLSVSSSGAAFEENRPEEGRASVVSVDEKQAFVIINLGKTSGLEEGMRLSARRGPPAGQAGNAQAARLEVIELRDSLAACRVEYFGPQKKLETNEELLLFREE